ncbi:MAG TPA: hypothetical protein DET40_07965 [Lentisphaeria bacterium]|nr:MAG: hypothetical protein A2X45_11935 [Lentisphaerae bacterium GWF2_50_93]HCE43470.1 hypothetical protein [Lentisphaeria bacterium]
MIDLHIKKIWLVRHAQSRAQTEEEYGIDAGLSKNGVRQAERLAKVFNKTYFDRIYLSPLKRSRETFEASKIKGACVEFDSRLIEELPEGAYSHILPYDILPDYARNDRHNAWLASARSRAVEFMDEIYSLNDRNILIVSHCGFLNHLLTVFISWHENDLIEKLKYCHMNNTGISVFSLGADRRTDSMLAWNDVRHVHDLITPDPLLPLVETENHKAGASGIGKALGIFSGKKK